MNRIATCDIHKAVQDLLGNNAMAWWVAHPDRALNGVDGMLWIKRGENQVCCAFPMWELTSTIGEFQSRYILTLVMSLLRLETSPRCPRVNVCRVCGAGANQACARKMDPL